MRRGKQAEQRDNKKMDLSDLIEVSAVMPALKANSKKQLLQLRARCTDAQAGHCGILDELVAAAHGEACACHAPVVPPRN